MIARMRIGLVLSCLFGVVSTVSAQTSVAPRRVYTNKTFFTVPLKIDDADRVKITALKFYVKPPGGEWSVAETGNAQTGRFNYHARDDGEYQFLFVTVDATGRESPSNVENEVPRLLVQVDTRPPEFLATPVVVASGQSFVQCIMKDANPDLTTITVEIEGTDGSFTPLLPVDTSVPGFFRVPATGMPNRVRVGGKDKAGNAALIVVSVSTAPTSPPVVTPAVTKAPPVGAETVAVPVSQPKSDAALTPPAVKKLEPIAAPTLKSTGSGLLAPEPIIKTPAPLSQPEAAQSAAPTPEPTPSSPPPPREIHLPPVPRISEKSSVDAEIPTISGADQTIASNKCKLTYAVDGIDASVLQKVEAYFTSDEGKTWQKLAEDPDLKSPIELQLPGDGRFGIIIAITAAGHSVQVPKPGEQPDWWIEVDTSVPEVTLESATPGTGEDSGLLLLKWHVTDKNLKTDAVEFAWSNSPDGPWHTIAKGLRAEGLYRWPVPREAGSKAYLKIEAQDKAGNIGRAATSQPVPVEVNRPRAKVLGINPAAMKQ